MHQGLVEASREQMKEVEKEGGFQKFRFQQFTRDIIGHALEDSEKEMKYEGGKLQISPELLEKINAWKVEELKWEYVPEARCKVSEFMVEVLQEQIDKVIVNQLS